MNLIKNCKLLRSKLIGPIYVQKCDHTVEQNKTLVVFVSHNQEVRYIKAVSNFGFRFNNDMFAIGPIVIFNEILMSWNIRYVKEINPHSLSLFRMFVPKFEVIILGVGDDMRDLHDDLIPYLSSNRVPYEIHKTKDACKLYNMMAMDRRNVAACLVPQQNLGIQPGPKFEDFLRTLETRDRVDLENEGIMGRIWHKHFDEYKRWLQEAWLSKEDLKKKIAAQNYQQAKRLSKMEFQDKIAEEIRSLKEEEFLQKESTGKKAITEDDKKPPTDPNQKLIK